MTGRAGTPWVVASTTMAGLGLGFFGGGAVGSYWCHARGICDAEEIVYMTIGALVGLTVVGPALVVIALCVEWWGSIAARVIVATLTGLVMLAPLGASVGSLHYQATHPYPSAVPYECRSGPVADRPPSCEVLLELDPSKKTTPAGKKAWTLGGAALGAAFGAAGFGKFRARELRGSPSPSAVEGHVVHQ